MALMKGLFKRKATIEAEEQAAQAVETADIGISDDFMHTVIQTHARLTPEDRKMTQQYKDQLNALSFVVHTLEGQKGITASVQGVCELNDGRTFCAMNIRAGGARLKGYYLLLWLDDDKIMINRDILSKKKATNFMNPAERKTWMMDLAKELAAKEKSARISDRQKGYYYECLDRRKGRPDAQTPYFVRKPGGLEV